MKAKIIVLTALISIMFVNNINAQIEKFQAAYIVNFTRFIEWPADYIPGNFIIGVLNNDPIVKELESIAPNKTVFGKKIEVKVFNSPEAIKPIHIIFIPAHQSAKIDAVTTKLNGQSTLIVSHGSNGINEGSGINFLFVDNKLQFEIKKSNITKYNLKVSSDLENLARKKY
ncbi:MAG: YfiR family protein [Bacteroidales bacterium]|nr:YfiR family protein [Bacteroidales bacterium]